MKVITRSEAKALGLTEYFTGEPCLRGGIAPRRTSSGTCLCADCRKERSSRNNAWNKKFRAENPEEAIRRERAHYHRNREQICRDRNEWYAQNKERLAAKGRKVDYERVRERSRKWKLENPEARRADLAKQRATKRKAVPVWYSEFDDFVIQEAFGLAKIREKETGARWDVDHMVPLRSKNACGLHCADNIQVIPKFLNAQKGNKLSLSNDYEWVKFAWAR